MRVIAAKAGVSVGTVSAVCNHNSAIRVSERTRRRVLRLLQAANYQRRQRSGGLSLQVFSYYSPQNPMTMALAWFGGYQGVGVRIMADGWPAGYRPIL